MILCRHPTGGKAQLRLHRSRYCAGGDRDMIENYMDYAEDACAEYFHQQPKERIRTVMNVNPGGKELKTPPYTWAALPSGAPVASFNVSRRGACSPANHRFHQYQASNNPLVGVGVLR